MTRLPPPWSPHAFENSNLSRVFGHLRRGLVLRLGTSPPREAGRMRLGRVVGPNPFGLGFRWACREGEELSFLPKGQMDRSLLAEVFVEVVHW
ncbi:hypothetical protein BHM03_00001090 [Ensete ventricosum]|nr:hypothetical protein BHM03_00001090 [Ensete ventricosum]